MGFKPLFLLNPMITSPSIIEIHYSLPVVPLKTSESYEATGTSILENVHVLLDPLPKNLTWESLFPVWIDEDHTWNAPVCPEVPLPQVEGTAADVDVVVVKTPCDGFSESKGLRDVFRLQVNLAAAKLVVESGRRNVDRTVYVVFIGSCEPMHEIFRCDERVRRVGKYWVYRPNLKKLKQKLLMPVGSCQIAPPVTELGTAPVGNSGMVMGNPGSAYPPNPSRNVETAEERKSLINNYIIIISCPTCCLRDVTPLIRELSLPGGNYGVERISSPFSEKGSYNEWNYSKLRVWQATDYDKLVFIDADFIIAKNVDYLFFYPQLSAAGNNRVLFNSGVMPTCVHASQDSSLVLTISHPRIRTYRFKPLFLLNPMITSPSIIEIHYSLPVVPVNRNPRWLRLIKNFLPDQKKIRVGLLNIAENERESYEATGTSILENVHVLLDPLPKNLTWESLFPVWIDEDHTWNAPVCPEVPLPQVEGTAADVDVVVVKTPCDGFSESKGLRDVFRLQVNLAAAKLVVESGRRNVDRTVYVVFIGSCEPMHEIFRCDERVRRVGKYWVYRPNLKKLQTPLYEEYYNNLITCSPNGMESNVSSSKERTLLVVS
ncbi:hypothetical protein Bca52824_075932 [Brassica carinata]|uniref:Hexosyltransferase n=1 Tax=Brassica carinata TaxID=52824 RepID=A0A8X7PU30_BRACI|nr:hypothetical protein Bca52824_075932 [Brassica carinata]